mmetsp:Transcript_1944/g.3512  ORF Transcript_1944/g.3512 Transcript_1944/m.3512 type:complete len:83 (-) Transcript_1944:2130-2378(-)
MYSNNIEKNTPSAVVDAVAHQLSRKTYKVRSSVYTWQAQAKFAISCRVKNHTLLWQPPTTINSLQIEIGRLHEGNLSRASLE